MSRLDDFFGVPQPIRQPQRPQIRGNQGILLEEETTINQVQQPVEENLRVQMEQPGVEEPRVIAPEIRMVNRNQNADEVVQQIQYQNVGLENNLTAMIERIMMQNGMNTGFRRPNFTSPLSEYVLQTDLPPRCKVPKFTKFSGDTTESTIEHVARYLIEAEEISNNENLRIKYFPSSLTKNAFTWFTTLPPNSIHH